MQTYQYVSEQWENMASYLEKIDDDFSKDRNLSHNQIVGSFLVDLIAPPLIYFSYYNLRPVQENLESGNNLLCFSLGFIALSLCYLEYASRLSYTETNTEIAFHN